MPFLVYNGVCTHAVERADPLLQGLEFLKSATHLAAGTRNFGSRDIFPEDAYGYMVVQGEMRFAGFVPNCAPGSAFAEVVSMHGPIKKIQEELDRFIRYASEKGFTVVLNAPDRPDVASSRF